MCQGVDALTNEMEAVRHLLIIEIFKFDTPFEEKLVCER